jgi:predicted nucleic-acid-binding Zn-ribbon protein
MGKSNHCRRSQLMIKCSKCKSRMFLDRQYSRPEYLEVFCLTCGNRKFYNPPSASSEGTWLLQKEILKAKSTISHL